MATADPSAPPSLPTLPGLLIDLLGPDLAPALGFGGGDWGVDDAGKESVDAAYWRLAELAIALRLLSLRSAAESVRAAASGTGWGTAPEAASSPPSGPGGAVGGGALAPAAVVGVEGAPDRTSARLSLLRGALSSVESALDDARRAASVSDRRPVFVRVSESYGLDDADASALRFLVTMKRHRSPCLRALLPPGHGGGDGPGTWPALDEGWTGSMIEYGCGLSRLDLGPLMDDSHPLVRDGVVRAEDDDILGSGRKFSVPDEVCRALLGEELGSEDRLRLSGTRLLAIVVGGDGSGVGAGDDDPGRHGGEARGGRSPGPGGGGGAESAQATVDEMLRDLDMGGAADEGGGSGGSEGSYDEVGREEALGDGEEDGASAAERDGDSADGDDGVASQSPTPPDSPPPAAAAPSSSGGDGRGEPRPYSCELDYLNDQLSLLLTQVECSNRRHERELRDASVQAEPRWMKGDGGGGGKRSSVGELTAKLRMGRRMIELSLELTRREGRFYPRLEVLVRQLGLDDFEKSVILYLAGSMVSPVFKSGITDTSYRSGSSGRKCTVGDLLLVLCDSMSHQVSARTYFYRSSRLVRKGLVRVCSTYGAADLTDQELQLDRRVLDCVVGLDGESTEVARGSHLYDPTVDIGSVVLKPGLKDGILASVANFDRFRAYRRRCPGLDDAIPYGTGLTLMFCGPSGTGKTMTANAVAAAVGKRLLLVDFPRLAEPSRDDGGGGSGSRFQSVFREAELSDAIIFFDECEQLFARRDSGPSQVTELLTELERFDGVVFLATNRPFDLDEAMHRRISEVFEFAPPDHVERLEIWRLLTAHDAVPCDGSIDWEAVALRYELTGGFIKNAVLAALLAAVGRCPDSPVVLESDIVDGCKKQMRGALQMRDFDERRVPAAGLEDLVVADPVRRQLRDMVDLEKARGILFGAWGFDDSMRERQGTAALFWGPGGTGRARAAEAVGYELGRPLKVVDFPQLLGRTGKANAAAVREVFGEARLMDAVLVLGGLSMQADGAGATAEDVRLLNLVVREMTRFPGVVILMVDTADCSIDYFASRLEKGLLNGIKFLVGFTLPNIACRELLWKNLLPPTVPTSEPIDFGVLAKISDKFNFVQIANAVYRSAAAAALRPEKRRCLTMSDFRVAIDDERKRSESAADRWVKSQYL